MLGARRGRFFRDGVEIHDVVSAMREMTEGLECYLCDVNKAEAALLITKRDDAVQNAPVVPICQACLDSREGIEWIHERMNQEMMEGKLMDLPSLHVKPALLIRTDKPADIVGRAIAHLGDAVKQSGSHFEIVEKDHQFFYKPGGQTSIHYFRESDFIMQVTQDLQMVDGIEFFDRAPWDDMDELMHIISKTQDFATETALDIEDEEDVAAREATAGKMADWLKELIWWRLQRAIESQKQRDQRSSRLSTLMQNMPPELLGLLGALGGREDCDCELCTARRAGQDMGPEPTETIH